MVQEVGFAKLQALGIKLVAADSPHSFLDDTPTSKLIRQILGAVSEFDKAMIVAKLKGARERKRVITGKKVEGRKSHAELAALGGVFVSNTRTREGDLMPRSASSPHRPRGRGLGPSSTTLARRVPPLSQGPFNAQKLSEPLMISEP